MSPIASNLKSIRGNHTCAEFAEFLGVQSLSTYRCYECSSIQPSKMVLKRIAKRLGLTMIELKAPLSAERLSAASVKFRGNSEHQSLLKLSELGKRIACGETAVRWLLRDGEFELIDIARAGVSPHAWRVTQSSVDAFIKRRLDAAHKETFKPRRPQAPRVALSARPAVKRPARP